MKLSELPGIPAPPMEKQAAETTHTPYALSQEPGEPSSLPTYAGMGGAAFGGKFVHNLLQGLGEGLQPSVRGVPNISNVLDKVKTRETPNQLLSALRAKLKSFRPEAAGGLQRFFGAGAKVPTSDAILAHLRESMALSGAGKEKAITTAARTAASQFKPRGAWQAFKGLGGKWKNPLKARGARSLLMRLRKPGAYGLMAALPLLLGYLGKKALD